MPAPKPTRRSNGNKMPPGRRHWWWRESALKRALEANAHLDHYFHWKVQGRKSPTGRTWSAAERRAIETALWLYELDARISRRFLFGKPSHLLASAQLDAVIQFAWPVKTPAAKRAAACRRRSPAWVWIEHLDKRNEKRNARLTPAELNGAIAAMRFCLDYFVRA